MTSPPTTEPELLPDDADPSGPAAGPRRRRRPSVAVALVVLLAVTSAVLGVLLLSGGDDQQDRIDELRQTAGQFAEVFVTYDYEHPDLHKDAVLGFATGSFREEYEDAFDQGLGPLIAEVEAVSQGYVKDVYVSAIDEERAQAVVSVDIEHSGSGGERTLYDIYFRLTFVEVGGVWKVDQVTDLNFGGAPTEPGADVTTDTTVPTATSVP